MSTQAIREDALIVEEMPASLAAASRRNALQCLAIIIFAGSAIHIAGLIYLHRQESVSASLAFWSFVAVIGLGITSLFHYLLKTQTPTVELNTNKIFVRYGNRNLEASVKDCHVRLGTAGGMRLPGGVVCLSRLPVILIDLPQWWDSLLTLRRRPQDITTVAVGYTDTMRARWEAALLQCGTSHATHRSTV